MPVGGSEPGPAFLFLLLCSNHWHSTAAVSERTMKQDLSTARGDAVHSPGLLYLRPHDSQYPAFPSCVRSRHSGYMYAMLKKLLLFSRDPLVLYT